MTPEGSPRPLPAPALPPLASDVHARLEQYAALVTHWNATIRLVSQPDLPHLWQRHIADSLQLAALLPAGLERGIDLGSGAGLPGLVLAIATGCHFDLVESDQRKAAFLREAARTTAAPVSIHAGRIETLRLAPAPLVTARALAPLPKLLSLAAPLLAPDGICLFLKGERYRDELDDASRDWTMTTQAYSSATSTEARILAIHAISPRGAAA